MKRTRKQIGSLLLAVCMVFTMMPTVAFADSTSQIISFEALANDVDFQEVKSGTTVDGLNLPNTLTATVTTGSAYTATVYDWVSVPLYDGNTTGNYTFTPTLNLPSDVTLADGVTPPTITVYVLPFVPVTKIDVITYRIGTSNPVALSGKVVPADATNQDIAWKISDAGTTGATITDGILSATAAGAVTVIATIKNGKAVGEDYDSPSYLIKVTALTVDPKTCVFDTLEEGYGTSEYFYLEDAQPKTFTITNMGDTEITDMYLAYPSNEVSWYSLSDIPTHLGPKASVEFTVKPISNLSAGNYTTTLYVVTERNDILASIPVSLTVTERLPRLRFGETDVHKVDTDFSGTGYSWNATTKTLTLTSDYEAGSIEFFDFDSEMATLKLSGDVTIDETASWGSCLYNTGNLTIDLDGHTLTLITGGDNNEALSGRETTIQNGTLVARLLGSSTEESTPSIYASDLFVENATVIADADSLNYGGIHIQYNLTLKQGAKIYTYGLIGLKFSSSEFLNLESDDISLTAIGSMSAVDLQADLKYTAGSALNFWTNTDTTQPSPAGGGTLLSSKTRDECRMLWATSKYVYIGTKPPKNIVTVTNGTGSGEYTQNAFVNITADTPPSGKQFKEWTVISGGVTLANSKAANTTFTMPANAVEITATYEDISTSTPVTGNLTIGFDPTDPTSLVSDLRYDASGTNWSWDASANTLTLTGAIGGNGAINFDATGDITVTVNGDVSATALKHAKSSAGKLNINGSGTLTLTNTYTNDNAISAQGGLEIADITVNASTVGNYSNAVNVYAGNFTMESGTLNLSTTGNYSSGISCEDGSILIFGTAQVKTNPSVAYYGLYVGSGKNIEISGGTVDVTSTNGTGIIANREVCISGGMVIAKSTYYRDAVRGVTDGVTVSGGTLVTGTVGASPVNGNVGSDITVSGDNTQVTVNGSVVNSSDLTVSGGNVTVAGTVQGSQNLTGGTVYVNGVQVYPSAFTYAVTVNNGTANPSTASAGATVTITANTPDDGKRFKEWTVVNGGVTLVNAQTSSTTFTMPANVVEITATYENIPDIGNDITANFPDANFLVVVRKALKKAVDEPIYDNDDFASIKRLDAMSKNIESLEGIEYFTELAVLYCNNNNLTELDVSNNTKLTWLSCNHNQLSALDVSNNTVLTNLYCYNNKLKTLDVSRNTVLIKLHCNNNQLTELDVSKNASLTELFCEYNKLTELDVSKNKALAMLDCYYNYMSGEAAVKGLDKSLTTDFTFDPQNSSTSAYTVTVNSGTASSSTAVVNATVTITAGSAPNGQRFKEWTVVSGGVTLENSQASSTTFIMPANAVEVIATYEDISDGGSGGGSSSGGSSPTNTATIKKNQPNQPITAVSSVTATVGTKGKASASIPDKAVTDAISKAQEEATKQKKTENGISIGLNVTMPKGATTLTATLSQNALNSLVSAGVTNLEINGSPVTISFDKKALKEIQKQTSGNVNIAIAPQAELSETAKAIIGTRPVYNITVGHGNNDTVSSFSGGAATIAIPYTPANGEVISGLYAVYVDENGNATRVEGSVYDVDSGSVLFTTPHFSMYGVGYTAPSEKLTDISNHWAKESIDYVVDKGMIDGATETTFAPDTFMTRGTLVTALGRLTGKDVSSYTTSSFTDVDAGSTSQPYIEWAYEKGIIHGIGNDEFAPERAITREEIAVIIANFTKATGYTLPVAGEATAYTDASSIGDYYKTAVTAMQQAGIMTGGTDNKFNPKSNATRAEVSSMLHRYIKLIVD